MRDLLVELKESLLRAGLSPRHVERYLRELSEHHRDIAEDLQRSGLGRAEAHRAAQQRLGHRDALLLPMLADRRFRSAVSRFPALFYLALPLLLQIGLIAGAVLGLSIAAGTSLRPDLAALGNGMALMLLACPVVIAWLGLCAARRRRAALRWPIAGAMSGIVLATALQIGVTMPTPQIAGQIGVSLGTPSLLPLLALGLISLLPLALPHLD